jgi:N-acetylmuramoyl-L-alanine amidase
MKTILIIAGHQNVQYNSITSLHGNTGTIGELEINVRIADRLSSLLRGKGFEVVQSDANANDNSEIRLTDFNLALALHCDMDTPNDNGGGMIASGDPSVDSSWQESARIKDVIESIYFKETQIVNKNYTTTGMTKYYIWQYLSDKTPCVLIEMGQAKDPHDSVLLGNTDLIAGALSKAICEAFGITSNIPTPTPVCPPDLSSDLTECVIELESVKMDLANKMALLSKVKEILWEKGWVWVMRNKLRDLLPKQ